MDSENDNRIRQLGSKPGTSRVEDVGDDLEGTECRLQGDSADDCKTRLQGEEEKDIVTRQANGGSVISIERTSNSSDDDSSRLTKLKQNNSDRSKADGLTLTENVEELHKLKSLGPTDSGTSDDDTDFRSKVDDIATTRESQYRERDTNSDASDIEEDDEDGRNEWTMDSEEEIDEPPEEVMPLSLKREKPKPKWFVVPELFSREIGKNPLFRQRYHGSLHVAERFELMHKFEGNVDGINTISFNQKGNFLASGADNLTVVIWDWPIGKKKEAFYSGHTSSVVQAKWIPFDMETFMVTCACDKQVRLLDLNRGTSLKLETLTAIPYQLAVHPQTPYVIISVSQDARVLSIDIREHKSTELLVVKDGSTKVELYTVDFHPFNSNEFCVGGNFQIVRTYDRRKLNKPLYEFCPGHMISSVYTYESCAVYNYNGTEILVSYNDENIYLFDTVGSRIGEFVHRYQGHRNDITQKKGVNFFGPKSEYIVSGSDCCNIFIWDKDSEAIVNIMTTDDDVVNNVEPHPHIPILATSGFDHNIVIWKPSCKSLPAMTKIESQVKANDIQKAGFYECLAIHGLEPFEMC